MKVAIIGTSHVGALKAGWETSGPHEKDLELTFFGLPGYEFAKSRIQNGVLSAQDQEHALWWMEDSEINLGAFDQILVVGLRFAFTRALMLIARHELLELPSGSDYPYMSLAAMGALIDGLVKSEVDKLIEKFGADPRFCFLPAPFPLARSCADGPGQDVLLKDIGALAHGAPAMEAYEASIAHHLQTAGVKFLLQPAETRHGPATTQDRFARTQDIHPEHPDHRHMNAAYGQLAMDSYIEKVLQPAQVRHHGASETA